MPKRTKLPPFPLKSLYLYISDDCNLNCRHCWITPSFKKKTTSRVKDNFVELKYLKRVIRDAKALGLGEIKLTGGEPFMRGDIFDIISFAKELNVGSKIETNGTLITRASARRLKRLGVSFMSVSLDGVRPDTHDRFRGRAGSFNEAVRGIRHLVETGIYPQVIMSITPENKGEIEDLIGLSQKLGAYSFKMNPVMPMGRAISLYEKNKGFSIDELLKLLKRIEGKAAKKFKIPVYPSLPLAFTDMELFQKSDYSYCNIHNILGILANGDVSICGIGQSIKELVFGNIKRDRIKNIWEKDPTLEYLRMNVPQGLKGLCSNCLMKNICLGNCIALTYQLYKDFTRPYWMCEEAERHGLFPESRLIKR